MIETLLSHYFEISPHVTLMEDYYIDPSELHYYLYSYSMDGKKKYLIVLEGGVDVNEDADSVEVTVERLKEHAGVTVSGWHVLNSAKTIVGKDTLNNEEAGRNLDKLFFHADSSADGRDIYMVADVRLDFDPKVYK